MKPKIKTIAVKEAIEYLVNESKEPPLICRYAKLDPKELERIKKMWKEMYIKNSESGKIEDWEIDD